MAIPKAHYGRLQGFLEVLDNVGSKSDLASVALKQGLELDDLLPIVEAGKMLGLIEVHTGDVSLTEKGHLFIAASPKVRKKILHDTILRLEAFKRFSEHMQKSSLEIISKEDLLNFLFESGHATDSHGTTSDFDWFIEWGRQGLVLTYDANNEMIRLRSKP